MENKSSSKLPRPPRQHRADCECSDCRVRRRIRTQITIAEQVTLARVRQLDTDPETPKRIERSVKARAAIAAEVAATDVYLEKWHNDIERIETDPKTCRFRELIASGVPRADAFITVDKEFPE